MSLKSPVNVFMEDMPDEFYSSLSGNASNSDIRNLIYGVCSSPSLSKNEKSRVLSQLSSLSNYQILELNNVFEEESGLFSELMKSSPEEVSELVGYSTVTWLLIFEGSLSNKLTIDINSTIDWFFELCLSDKYRDALGMWLSNGYYWAGFIKSLIENNKCEKISFPLSMLRNTLNNTNLLKSELMSLTSRSSIVPSALDSF